jgi:hypothetical protein
MKHIKLFENFKHRKPTMITLQEYQQKFNTHGTEPFTKEEYDFLRELEQKNEGWIYDFDLCGYYLFMQLYPIGDGDDLIEINITKLKDNWYLIDEIFDEYDESGSDNFLCDEWDEVLGYLGSQTPLKF